ncbi:GFA family protein [Aquirhabdus parva]|uniref:GFA family protein n=1 Tax=Aquirhabdus parva TaxID=2283318 RepID=A0A345P4F1_9GAMM|nr:GFA family protein [Aquirhabdus parva]AXI02160.1 GFA family protein [Aquirhabdus parva]
MTTYLGACHCGSVKFSINSMITELTTCDCTLCLMRNAVMARVPEQSLKVIEGEKFLTLYQWNTFRAKHYFCSQCGIYVFHRKRAMPDHFGINVFCLTGFDMTSVAVRATDGANMSLVNSSFKTH